MKVLMVAPPFLLFPTGIAYVAAAIKDAGHAVACHVYVDDEKLSEILRSGPFDVLMTGGLSSQFKDISSIVLLARKHGVKVIAGGGIVTSEPEIMTSALKPDFGVINEGEITSVELLRCLEDGGDITNVNGITYLEDGKYVQTAPRKEIEDLDSLPWPYYEGFSFGEILDRTKSSDLDFYDIFDYPREYLVVGSRSCPFQCTFCYHPSGFKYRQRSVDSIISELRFAIPTYRINMICLVEELFSHDEKRVYEFCEKFRELVRQYDWKVVWSCQLMVTGAKPELLDAMRDSGCYALSYGFESYSRTVLKSMKKKISPEDIHGAIHLTMDAGISIQGSFIFGDRAETPATANETLDFWREHADAGIFLGFIVACPDSELYRHACGKGVIKDRLDFIKNHLFDVLNMTEMPDSEFLRLRAMVVRHVFRYYPYSVPLSETEDSVTMRCPHCGEMTTYRNYFHHKPFEAKSIHCRACRKRSYKIGRFGFLLNKIFGRTLNGYTYPFFRKANESMPLLRSKVARIRHRAVRSG